MKTLPLSGKYKNLNVVLDDEDYARVSKYKWGGIKGANTYYAVRKEKGVNIRLSRYTKKLPIQLFLLIIRTETVSITEKKIYESVLATKIDSIPEKIGRVKRRRYIKGFFTILTTIVGGLESLTKRNKSILVFTQQKRTPQSPTIMLQGSYLATSLILIFRILIIITLIGLEDEGNTFNLKGKKRRTRGRYIYY